MYFLKPIRSAGSAVYLHDGKTTFLNLVKPFRFLIPESDWLTYDHDIPSGVHLNMRNDPLVSQVVGYFYEFQPAHGAEHFQGTPESQNPPDGWDLTHFWYGDYWIRMIKVGAGPDGLVTPLTQSYCEFHVGPHV